MSRRALERAAVAVVLVALTLLVALVVGYGTAGRGWRASALFAALGAVWFVTSITIPRAGRPGSSPPAARRLWWTSARGDAYGGRDSR